MKKQIFTAFACVTALLLAPLSSFAESMQPGKITVRTVEGAVFQMDAEGNSTPVKAGAELAQGAQIVTGPKSSAFVVLSSGSSFVIDAETDVEFTSFLQVPYTLPAGVDVATLKKAPSTSKALVTVNSGTLSGHTAKLNEGSELRIKTPSGTDAVIRGTDYTVTVITVDGMSVTTITNATGEVVAIANGNPVNIPAGQSVSVQAERTVSASGEVTFTITSVGEPTPATPEQLIVSKQAVEKSQKPDGPGPDTNPGPGPDIYGPGPDTNPGVDVVISPAS